MLCDTDWRQGDLLPRNAAIALGLITKEDQHLWVVVITHDCDLRHKDENVVEFIVAKEIPNSELDPQFASAKNPRRLHLPYTLAGKPLVLELQQSNKRNVPKADFAQDAAIGSAAQLDSDAKPILKQWLAARYGRPAFPNAFEERIRKKVGKKTVEQHIVKILKPHAKYLIGLFIDLGENRTTELSHDEPYVLSIWIVYDANEGGSQAIQAAKKVAEQLHHLFNQAYDDPETATEIALEKCEVEADTMMTLAAIRRMDQWRLEYISLSEDKGGSFFPAGVIPP